MNDYQPRKIGLTQASVLAKAAREALADTDATTEGCRAALVALATMNYPMPYLVEVLPLGSADLATISSMCRKFGLRHMDIGSKAEHEIAATLLEQRRYAGRERQRRFRERQRARRDSNGNS